MLLEGASPPGQGLDRIGVLHYDWGFDVIAEATRQSVEWVMPCGTAD